MPGNADNIIVGAAEFQINSGGGYTDVGYTKGGCTVRYDPTWLEVEADQAAGVVRRARPSERLYVLTTLLEATLARIREAFMQPASNLVGSTLTLGYNNACWTEELGIRLIGVGPSCGTRTWTLPTCVSMESREYAMKREEETAFEVQFEVLKDSNGNFGTVVDS